MTTYTRDAIERVLWTLAQASAGAALDVLVSGEVTWKAVVYAVLVAILKVVVAGQFGNKQSAALPDA